MTELSQRSVVQRRDGTTLAVLHADENRAPVKLADVPDAMINAVIGVEDDRFWKHHGIDLRGTVRALATNVSAGAVRQGGSTITQQLVKNSLLTPEKTVDRKVREALLAWRLEDHTSKNEILERYLNTVYFGNGAYGVQAAAEVYFGKQASQLDEADAVLLAGTDPQSGRLRPDQVPERGARPRREVVVDRLVKSGMIGEDAGGVGVGHAAADGRQEPRGGTERLLRRRGEAVAARRTAAWARPRRSATTRCSRAASRSSRRSTATCRRRRRRRSTRSCPTPNGKFTAALGIGRTVEWSGARHRRRQGLRHRSSSTSRRRRTASPAPRSRRWCWSLRIEQGYGPSTIVDGTSPCTVKFPGHKPYVPGNYEGEGGGPMPLIQATAHSVNCAYVRLASAPGLDNVVQAAKDLGITSSSGATAIARRPHLGGLRRWRVAARDGVGVRDARRRRRVPQAVLHREGARPTRQGVVPRRDEGRTARRPCRRHAYAVSILAVGRERRHRHAGQPRQVAGVRQDRHRAGLHRRMVRRRDASARRRGVDGIARRQGADARRAGPRQRGRRLVPGADLGSVHEASRWRAVPRSRSRRRIRVALPTSSCRAELQRQRLDHIVVDQHVTINPDGIGVSADRRVRPDDNHVEEPAADHDVRHRRNPPPQECQEPPDWPDNYPPFCG